MPGRATVFHRPDALPDTGRVLILSPCENIPGMFEPTHRFHIVRARSISLGAELLGNIEPDVIVAPIVGQHHDILEVGEALRDLGFQGTLCAVSKPPIKAGLVMAELRNACPKLRVCLAEAIAE